MSTSFIRHTKFGSYEHDVEPINEAESIFRHSGWAVRRLQIWESLKRTGTRDSRLSRFANCGSGLWLQTDEARQQLHLSCNKCHDRWCVACANERLALMREKLCQHLAGRHVRFLTLTLRHSPTPLIDQLDRLYHSFNRFRHRVSWKENVTGGCAFPEVKLGERDGLWHVHLHILIEGSFWAQREISREWHAVTGDSSIIDMRKVSDGEHAAYYVTKYVTKPADASVFANPDKLDELLIALRGRKLIMPFGKWRSMKLTEKPRADVKWINVAKVEKLQHDASNGDRDAIRWLEAAARKWPIFSTAFAFSTDTS